MAYTPLPVPSDAWDHASRRNYSALRRRFHDGCWKRDAETAVHLLVGGVRKAHWNHIDTSICVATNVGTQLSVRYHHTPNVSNTEAPAAADVMIAALDKSSRWVVAQELQRYTEEMRECALRHEWNDGEGRLQFSLLTADTFEAEADPQNPRRPVYYRIKRCLKWRGRETDMVEIFDVRDPAAPSWRIEIVDGTHKGENVGKAYGVPAAYPYIDPATSKPYIPITLYHGRWSPGLFDPFYGHGLVDATFAISCLVSFSMHIARNHAHPAKNIIDLIAHGTSLTNVGTAYAESDPGAITRWTSTKEKSGAFHEWREADPLKPLEVADRVITTALHGYGITPAENQRVSAEGRTGYAIQLSRSTIRERQRQLGSVYKEPDVESLRISALLLNKWGGASLPTEGWDIGYVDLPLSEDEKKTRIDNLVTLKREGALSQAGFYAGVHGVTPEAARKDLDAIAKENKDNAPAGDAGTVGARADALMALADKVSSGAVAGDTALIVLKSVFAMDADTADAFVKSIVVKEPAPTLDTEPEPPIPPTNDPPKDNEDDEEA